MMEEQKKAPLFECVRNYADKRPAYFCIPGHRYENGISDLWREDVGDRIFSYDLTEAHGLDDLHCPEGAIKEAQQLAASLYHVKQTYFLVNGSTCGNEAMLLAALRPGDKVLLPRNVHKSILMGLVLSGARPVWILPEYVDELGVYGCLRPGKVKEALDKDPAIRAVCLVSPNYYGMVSDIKAIADICHEKAIPLMVDEAHGGHLYFSDHMPLGALRQGADICVQSWHKVTGALTQSSVLHINSDRIDLSRVEDALKLVQSTSPSYLLMTSMDLARRELALKGREDMEKLVLMAGKTREALAEIPGVFCPGEEMAGKYGIAALDPARICINVEGLGIKGGDFSDRLFKEYGVDLELSGESFVLAILTPANTWEDVRILTEAVKNLAAVCGKEKSGTEKRRGSRFTPVLPGQILSPREVWFGDKEILPVKEAAGAIAAEAVIPYPPGIPLLYPGEKITEEIIEKIENLAEEGCHMHGMADTSLKNIRVCKERKRMSS